MKYKDFKVKYKSNDWQIKFIDIDSENFGETDRDVRIIRLFTKGRDFNTLREVLVHECLHVIFEDSNKLIFNYDGDNYMDKEEQLIRLLSPRLFHLFKDNPKLTEFIFKEQK